MTCPGDRSDAERDHAAEARDVEREGAIAGLRVAEQLLPEGDGLHAFDRDLRCFHWSDTMERISGVSRAAVLGTRLPDTFESLDAPGIDRYLRALDGESTSARDLPFFVTQSGRRGYYDARYAPLRDRDGNVIGGTTVVRDVTERKLAEERLRETEERFRNMADASPVLLWMSGPDALCTFFNQTWLDFTGRPLDREWGVGWCEGVHFEDLQRCMDTYTEAFNARRRFEMEYRLRRADGEYRWLLDRGTPRYGPDGHFAGFIGSCVDITEHKQVEASLRKAVQDRDEFLQIASHELRTPLTALQLKLGNLHRSKLGEGEGAVERWRRSVESALAQSKRLATLVDHLLDVSRVSEGRLELALEPLDLSALIGEVIERFAPADRSDSPAILASLAPAVTGRWDRLRLDQVATNLIGNALKYGGGKPVHVELRATDEAARLVVRDEGMGIAPGDQRRIFQRFERAVSHRHFGGFGLGLWITREIVEALGGSIEVASSLGAGAAFSVTLPRRGPDAAPPAGERAGAPPEGSAGG